MTEPVTTKPAIREWWPAVKRGFLGRCPSCNQGKLFRGYLKVNDCCPACGEELHHHRADDAPPYLTILVVGHIVGALMLMVEERNVIEAVWIHMILWPTLTLALALWMLPLFKGALVNYQWALRMHGFETVPNKVDGPGGAS
ncbi:MAG: DUF983 domain-containing protein [Beijerinckiaceae bacterium]|nr:DUF983 domain-containing protein [Beijerinckiaceae bacterium]MBX9761009.1 DUF983 domain-containing protein [Beijerinckiaceae bacterium]MDO9441737.1 DUF983 domain-containing protein [Beijerinckiaceae bacterium]